MNIFDKDSLTNAYSYCLSAIRIYLIQKNEFSVKPKKSTEALIVYQYSSTTYKEASITEIKTRKNKKIYEFLSHYILGLEA
jgi:hypothetical protein